eukprot:UC1_evm1s1826
MGDAQAEFNAILAGTVSPDAEVREQSEKVFAGVLTSEPDQTCLMLVEAARHGEATEVRQVGAVLLRRYLLTLSQPALQIWSRISLECKQALKAALLEALTEPQPLPMVRHKICDAVGACVQACASDIFHEAGDEIESIPSAEVYWPELVMTLWEMAQSGDPTHSEVALDVFSVAPDLFGGNLQRHAENVVKLVMAGLSSDAIEVQVAATKAYAAFTSIIDEETQAYFAEMTPQVLDVVIKCLLADKIEGAEMALQAMIEVATDTPKMLRSVVLNVLEGMVEIAGNTAVNSDCRKLALEVLVSLAESAPGMIRKVPEYCAQVIPLCMSLLLDVEDVEGWTTVDELEDPEASNDIAARAETSLDRLAIYLGARAVLPTAFQVIPGMLADVDWKQRAGGCFAISAIGEGCRKAMITNLDDVVEHILPLMRDEHPRVIYAATNAIGQLSLDCAPLSKKETPRCFQARFHGVVLPALVDAMGLEGHPRCQAHASTALDNFCEHFDKAELGPYLLSLLERIGSMLSSEYVIVQEAAVGTLATIAESAKELFVDYYPSFMPALKRMIASLVAPEGRALRAKCIDAVTIMGQAVGREMFEADAAEIMEVLRETESRQTSADDPQAIPILNSWTRICKILGEAFVPYLPHVIPKLIVSASKKVATQVFEEGDGPPEDEEWDTYELPVAGNITIGIKCSDQEDKRMACELLLVYAKELKAHFAPYVADIEEFMIELINYREDEEVRIFSSLIQPVLIEALAARNESEMALATWVKVMPTMLAAIEDESDWYVLSYQFCALDEMIDLLKGDAMTEEVMEKITAVMMKKLDEYNARAVRRVETRMNDRDHDEEQDEILSEDEKIDAEVIEYLQGCMHKMFGFAEEQYLPFFEPMLEYWIGFLAPDRHWRDLQWSLCVFDDIIEYCGEASLNYARYFAAPMVEAITHAKADVRMAAAYGVGCLATAGIDQYGEVCMAALPQLLAVVQDEGSRSDDAVQATETAISALTKIATNEKYGVDLAEFIPMLVSWMPITEDVEEGVVIWGFICSMIEVRK